MQTFSEIQDKLQSYDAGSIKLTLHIAVGAGTLWTFHLGGINGQYEFFPVGNVFGQISEALDKSKSGLVLLKFLLKLSGEVFLSDPAWRLVKNFCEGTEQDGDWFVTQVKPEYRIPTKCLPTRSIPENQHERIETIIRSYISIGIQDRIDAGQSQWLAEMRRISVVFVNLQVRLLWNATTLSSSSGTQISDSRKERSEYSRVFAYDPSWGSILYCISCSSAPISACYI